MHNEIDYYEDLLRETLRYDSSGSEARMLAHSLCKDFPTDSNIIKQALVRVLR